MNRATRATSGTDLDRRNTRSRLLLGIVLPASILAASYIPFLLVRSDLPERIASHFDVTGNADASMSLTTFLVANSALVVIGLALSIWLAWNPRSLPTPVGVTIGFLGPFLAALGGSILATTAVIQQGIENWTDTPSGYWALMIVIPVSVAAGVLGGRLGFHLHDREEIIDPNRSPVMELSDTEEAVWVTSIRSTPLQLVGLSVAAIGFAALLALTPWLGLVLIAASIPLISLASIKVRIDRAGLQVKYGPLPWPKTFIGVDRIKVASVADIRPSEWGGWGYRGSIMMMNQAAVVHRAGPGIRLDLKNGKVFAVTVDEPEVGVALLNAQVKRGVASV